MFLWHGTYEEYKDEIIKDGLIRCNRTDSTTEEYDDFFIKVLGYTPRKNYVYFSGHTDCANAYDFAFKVNTRDLDTSKLFIGDYRILDDLMGTLDENERAVLVNKYKDTLISFDKYINNAHGYLERDVWELEFLYFGDVNVTEKNLD